MTNFRLILVDGLPGSGKSATSRWLASLLKSKNLNPQLFQEVQPAHPTNVGGEIFPAGETPGGPFFERYNPEIFIDESLGKWSGYVSLMRDANSIGIFDSYPFQNSVRILLQMDASLDLIQGYLTRFVQVVRPLVPALIFFDNENTSQAVDQFRLVGRERGEMWVKYVVALFTNCPYAFKRNLKGYEGALEFIAAYQRLLSSLRQRMDIQHLVLENHDPSRNWDTTHQRIESFLE